MAAIKETPKAILQARLNVDLSGRQLSIREAVDYCMTLQDDLMPVERLPVGQALDRVLREDVLSRNPVPPFSKSLVDGYAIRYPDEGGLSEPCAVCLRVRGRVAAGDVPWAGLAPGEAVRIMTGAPIPDGTDRVVKIEQVMDAGATVFIRPDRHQNSYILQAGSDFQKNRVILSAGETVKPGDLAMMAACGCSDVLVSSKPSLGIISIGNEIIPVNGSRHPGQTWDVIGPLISAFSKKAGAEAEPVVVARDDVGAIIDAVAKLAGCDILILIGGMANGDFDLTRHALDKLNVQDRFKGTDILSTRRVFFGQADGRPVWALSGPAAAVMTNFLLLIRPVIDYMLGKSACGLQTGILPLLSDFCASGCYKRFLPGVLNWHEGQSGVTLFEEQRFGYFSPMQAADVLVELPPDQSEFKAGDKLKVYYID